MTSPDRRVPSPLEDPDRVARILGICPLLGVTDTLMNGLALGLATLIVLAGTSILLSAGRQRIAPAVRLPACLLIVATCVTVLDVLARAFTFDLYLAIGAFLPLIVANATIPAHAATLAVSQPVRVALADGLSWGGRLALLLIALGALRELVAEGALLSAGLGAGAARGAGFTLAAVPAGGFIALGLLLATRNAAAARRVPAADPIA